MPRNILSHSGSARLDRRRMRRLLSEPPRGRRLLMAHRACASRRARRYGRTPAPSPRVC
jgi:hypothetical protein